MVVRNNAMLTRFLVIAFLSILLSADFAGAHTLGVDKGELVEKGDGAYSLVSKVPQRLAHLITTIRLPERCGLQGNPTGERGTYEVRFSFKCARPLTADDTIFLPWKREGIMLTVNWLDAEPVTRFTRREGEVIPVVLAEYLAGSGSLWAMARRYTRLGFEHILEGVDHLLFVFGLLLLVGGGWRLVKTITAFTVAHSITLALATFGIVNVPPRPVEAAIALSIVFLAVEIIHAARGRSGLTKIYPWIVAFGFGLLHGLGFAGALADIGLPPTEIPQALLFFNIGVELGQLAFVAAVWPIIWLFRKALVPMPKWLELTPAYAIGTIAMYWFGERALSIFLPI